LTIFDKVALILNRHVIRSTITPGLGSWLKLFFFAIFVFLSQGSFNSSREAQLQIRPCICTSQLICLWVKQSNSEIFELETLEAK
jgi:hypothetical protein